MDLLGLICMHVLLCSKQCVALFKTLFLLKNKMQTEHNTKRCYKDADWQRLLDLISRFDHEILKQS